MTWFRVGGAGIPATLKNAMNAVFNKKFGTTGQNYPPKQWPDDVNLMGPLPEGTASGPIANFSDGADDVPVKSCVAALPASIDGYASVTAVRNGKNLFDKNNANIVDGYITTTGFSTANVKAKTIYIPIVGGATYTVGKTAGQRFQIATAEEIPSGNSLFTSRQSDSTASSLTITAAANDKYLWAWIFLEDTDVGTLEDMISSVQIEVGSASTTYSDFITPVQYSALLGRLIYGGSADLVTGHGVNGYAKGSMSSSYLSGLNSDYIGYESTTAYFGGHPSVWVRNWNYQTAAPRRSGGIGCACNYFPISMHNTTIFAAQYRIYFDVNGKNISSVQDFINFVANLEANNESLDIVYELAITTDFYFDDQEINSLYGVNNFWNDAGGDTTVVYRRDIDLALQSVSNSRGLMMASRPVTQLVGEESDPDQVNELVENDETEQEGEDNAR